MSYQFEHQICGRGGLSADGDFTWMTTESGGRVAVATVSGMEKLIRYFDALDDAVNAQRVRVEVAVGSRTVLLGLDGAICKA